MAEDDVLSQSNNRHLIGRFDSSSLVPQEEVRRIVEQNNEIIDNYKKQRADLINQTISLSKQLKVQSKKITIISQQVHEKEETVEQIKREGELRFNTFFEDLDRSLMRLMEFKDNTKYPLNDQRKSIPVQDDPDIIELELEEKEGLRSHCEELKIDIESSAVKDSSLDVSQISIDSPLKTICQRRPNRADTIIKSEDQVYFGENTQKVAECSMLKNREAKVNMTIDKLLSIEKDSRFIDGFKNNNYLPLEEHPPHEIRDVLLDLHHKEAIIRSANSKLVEFSSQVDIELTKDVECQRCHKIFRNGENSKVSVTG